MSGRGVGNWVGWLMESKDGREDGKTTTITDAATESTESQFYFRNQEILQD